MSELKYKVGDRVRIKSVDWYNRHAKETEVNWKYFPFSCYMKKYCGQIMTISIVRGCSYSMIEDDCKYAWTDEMIEGLVEEEVGLVDNLSSRWVNEFNLPDGYIVKDERGNVINATKIVLEKKKKEYPKTYEECAEIIAELIGSDCNPKGCMGYMSVQLTVLQKLLICRDAYWKIAGEEMGLGKPWEPTKDKMVYSIYRHSNEIETDMFSGESVTFEFPTPKMRDAFKENFGSDIEFCKELL